MEEDVDFFDTVDWDADAEAPPDWSQQHLHQVDHDSDQFELSHLLEMGVIRPVREGEDIRGYDFLTTNLGRDWRRRPGWTTRSRLVAREFKTWTSWFEELLAPASCLSVVHSMMALAPSKSLEVVTLDGMHT